MKYGYARVSTDDQKADLQHAARDTNPAVRHPVVDVETVWSSKIVAPIDARGDNNIGNGSIAFLWKHRRQHRLNRAITN
jgi:hypothetical protein